MKTQHATLISRKISWFFIAILLFYATGFPSGNHIYSDLPNDQHEIGIYQTRPAIGTRGLGLSRAYITSVGDATSPLWNPAGLASLDRGNLIYDFSQGAFSFAYPIQTIGTFGLNLLDLNASDRFLVNHTFNPIGTFEYGYNQVLLSYARKFGVLQLGGSTGYSRAPYINSLWSPNYDLGALLTLSRHAIIGMQYRDINSVSIRDDNGFLLTTFDPQFALGTTLIAHRNIRWHTCYNVTSPGFGTSLEILTGPFAANVGSLFSFKTGTPTQSWSFGLSFNKWGKQTYYTYLKQDNLEHKHLFAIGLTFGTPQYTPNKFVDEKVELRSNESTTSVSPSFPVQTKTKETEITIDISTTDTTPVTPEQSNPKAPQSTTDNTISTKPTSPTDKPSQPKVDSTSKIPEKKCTQIAEKHNISVELMLAIIYVESKFDPFAVSKTGAGGLMQMVPATARELGLKVPLYSNKLKPILDGKVDERFDAVKNLEAGLIYFNRLKKKYLNDLTLTLGAYNVGPGKVRVNGPLINRGKIYVEKVIKRRNLYQSSKKLLQSEMSRLETMLKK